MGEFVKFEVQDHIGIVTIHRPPVNAVCESIRLDLIEIFEGLNKRIDVYCVILRTIGPGFSGGHDLAESSGKNKYNYSIPRTINHSCDAIYRCRVPVIAAVHGYVIGMGLAYASICDMIVASDDASFKFPEINVGTVGGPFWLKRLIPDKIAREKFYLGEPLSAQEMLNFGAINRVVPKDQLMDAAMELAKKVAKKYPGAIWATKMCIVEGELEMYDIVDISARKRVRGNEDLTAGDPNKRELTRAQLEHREPVWDLEYLKRWENISIERGPNSNYWDYPVQKK